MVYCTNSIFTNYDHPQSLSGTTAMLDDLDNQDASLMENSKVQERLSKLEALVVVDKDFEAGRDSCDCSEADAYPGSEYSSD